MWVSYKKKYAIFFVSLRRKELDPEFDLDPLVRGMDPERTKMSQISNTDFFIITARGVGWIPGTAWRKNVGMSWSLSPSLPSGAACFFIELIDSLPIWERRDELVLIPFSAIMCCLFFN